MKGRQSVNHLGSLVIETEHLYLGPFVLEDAPAMFENWASDPVNPEICHSGCSMHPTENRESIIRCL